MATITRKAFKRAEIAYLMGVAPRRLAALCSPSKRTMIVDQNDPDIIDLNIDKNYRYISARLEKDESELANMPVVEKPAKKEPKKKKPVVKKKLTTQKKKKAPVKKVAKNLGVPKMENPPPPPKKKSEPKPVNEVKAVPIVDAETKRRDREARKQAKLLNDMDTFKNMKLKAEMELKQLELEQKRGDLISASEVIPFVTKLSKRRDDLMKTETISLIKDMMVEYQLEASFLGRFEREFIALMNETNKTSVDEFTEGVSNG